MNGLDFLVAVGLEKVENLLNSLADVGFRHGSGQGVKDSIPTMELIVVLVLSWTSYLCRITA